MKMSQVIYAGKQFATVTELKDAIYGHAKSVGLFVRTSISRSKEVEFRCKVDCTHFEELKKVNRGTIAVGMDGDHHLMLLGWGIRSP